MKLQSLFMPIRRFRTINKLTLNLKANQSSVVTFSHHTPVYISLVSISELDKNDLLDN